ncbi:lipoprotein [Amycolatopsis mediterranei S699]|uniref:Lipoprotein n=2 Tax=Amycolatopsis mediterranei TaxID=33910 RepID=A0A0H3CX99_AMYMU|nr:DUF58 domain-containing protein [Amycolatopsis mediterranei]ADJ42958.1 lipoprotein [Amycolatopsis mediterranei U32]AEK39653.1 lipoprotein [Amycolatopsis mediterranei S699]AFO74672.1 lipoprotein [Amycolatopsis mediterranei S699]AGT81801.1 lipoprotein [Amycolatopsis mediterranei RB]KDO04374.1 hypothetical protein DV26_44250 [Amycolatopsis mediterranei]
MAVTGRLGLLALFGALVVGLLLPSGTGMLAVAAVLLVLVVVDLVLAGSVRALTFARSGDTSVRLGEPCEVTLVVANPGGRAVRGQLRDAWPPSAGASDRHSLRVPAGERRALVTALRPSRRGDRTAARVTVRSVGPLGLAARQGSHEVPWTVRVLPPFHSRKHLPSRLARLQQLDGRNAVLIRGQGTEFDSLREYVIGDDVRSIDWRATARAHDVMVRTWRPERDRHVVLVLDTGRVSAGRVGDAPRLDAAMDAALLLAALASRAGDRVDLLAYDRRLRAAVQGSSGASLLTSLVNAMAPLEPSLVETDARGMIAEVLRRTRRRALVVLLTGLDAAPLEEGLFPVLSSLTGRHELVVASVADPRVAQMLAARGDAEAVYDAASAARTTAERLRVTERLVRHGVSVVDAVPEELPPVLADRYLALKAAGRL